MSQEDDMGTLTDDTPVQIELVEREMPEVPPAVIAAGVVAAVVGMGIVGWLLFRSRRRQTLMQRLQEAIPDRVRDFPTGIQARIRRAK